MGGGRGRGEMLNKLAPDNRDRGWKEYHTFRTVSSNKVKYSFKNNYRFLRVWSLFAILTKIYKFVQILEM